MEELPQEKSVTHRCVVVVVVSAAAARSERAEEKRGKGDAVVLENGTFSPALHRLCLPFLFALICISAFLFVGI